MRVKNKYWFIVVLLLSSLQGCGFLLPASVQEDASETALTPLDCSPPPPLTPANEPTSPWPTAVCPQVSPPKCAVCPAVKIANKAVFGEYELATLDPPGFKYLARIDTGATSTSIHANEIARFERDGRKWVRFQVKHPDTEEPITLERQLVRRIRIKQAENVRDRRLVVMMTLSVGNITRQVEVSLSDRSNMEFPVLIGRNFLLDTAVVDVSLRRIAE